MRFNRTYAAIAFVIVLVGLLVDPTISYVNFLPWTSLEWFQAGLVAGVVFTILFWMAIRTLRQFKPGTGRERARIVLFFVLASLAVILGIGPGQHYSAFEAWRVEDYFLIGLGFVCIILMIAVTQIGSRRWEIDESVSSGSGPQ